MTEQCNFRPRSVAQTKCPQLIGRLGGYCISVNRGIISYRIKVTGMDEEPVTRAHLHNGREGSNVRR